MQIRRPLTTLAICAALVCAAPPLHAQTDADKLFTEATELAREGKYSEACPKFEQSQKSDPALGTQYNLALCYEKLGKLGSAYRNYEQVRRLAHATGKKAREDAAQARVEALRERAAHLVLRSAAPDVTLKIDGNAVDVEEWGFYAVDPGSHTVDASASAKKPWHGDVVVPDVQGAEVRVEVPPLAVAAGQTRTVTITKEMTNVRRIAGFVLGGVGVVGVGAAITTGAFILSAQSTAQRDCTLATPTTPSGQLTCATQSGRDAVTLGKTLLPINDILWAVGLAALGGGSILLVASLGSKSAPVKTTITPALGLNGGGVIFTASFQ